MRRSMDEVRAELQARHAAYENEKRRRNRQLLVTLPVLVIVLTLSVTLIPGLGRTTPPMTPNSPGAPTDEATPSDPTMPEEPDPPQSIAPSAPGSTGWGDSDAIVADGVDSFAELLEKADLIIVGTVISSTMPTPYTETATVRVDKAFRAWNGEVPEEIKLYQIKEYDTVTAGNTYLLFLGKQADGPAEAFYAVGGDQGVIGYDAESGEIGAPDAHIDAADVYAWLQGVSAAE